MKKKKRETCLELNDLDSTLNELSWNGMNRYSARDPSYTEDGTKNKNEEKRAFVPKTESSQGEPPLGATLNSLPTTFTPSSWISGNKIFVNKRGNWVAYHFYSW